jgi:hypothetical protein
VREREFLYPAARECIEREHAAHGVAADVIAPAPSSPLPRARGRGSPTKLRSTSTGLPITEDLHLRRDVTDVPGIFEALTR